MFWQENLKILKQYGKLLTQACHHHTSLSAPSPAHAQPLSQRPTSYPRNLQWFEALTAPFKPLDEPARARIHELLELRAACSRPPVPLPDAPALRCELAAQLAMELPHMDRDLVAFSLLTPVTEARPVTELDVHVAHSLLRLTPDSAVNCPWRHQGLVHVLALAAVHMPLLSDWFPPPLALDPAVDTDAQALIHCLEQLNANPRDYENTIHRFIAALGGQASPTAQAILTTLDRLAILMGVKSNAIDEPAHDLPAALSSFPHLESMEPQDVWRRIKPALERALPPSLLRVEPASACARKRVKKIQATLTGTWCVRKQHAFTHSRTHAFAHSRIHALTHARIHAFTHSRTQKHAPCRYISPGCTLRFRPISIAPTWR